MCVRVPVLVVKKKVLRRKSVEIKNKKKTGSNFGRKWVSNGEEIRTAEGVGKRSSQPLRRKKRKKDKMEDETEVQRSPGRALKAWGQML